MFESKVTLSTESRSQIFILVNPAVACDELYIICVTELGPSFGTCGHIDQRVGTGTGLPLTLPSFLLSRILYMWRSQWSPGSAWLSSSGRREHLLQGSPSKCPGFNWPMWVCMTLPEPVVGLPSPHVCPAPQEL